MIQKFDFVLRFNDDYQETGMYQTELFRDFEIESKEYKGAILVQPMQRTSAL